MENKTLSTWIFISLGLAVFAALIEDGYGSSDVLYTIAGLGFFVFGAWAAVRLRKI